MSTWGIHPSILSDVHLGLDRSPFPWGTLTLLHQMHVQVWYCVRPFFYMGFFGGQLHGCSRLFLFHLFRFWWITFQCIFHSKPKYQQESGQDIYRHFVNLSAQSFWQWQHWWHYTNFWVKNLKHGRMLRENVYCDCFRPFLVRNILIASVKLHGTLFILCSASYKLCKLMCLV